MAKFPRNMLFARAMSNGVKWYCPDVTSGVTVYSEGEISGVNTIDAVNVPVDEYLSVDPNSGEVVGMSDAQTQGMISDAQAKRLFAMLGAFAGENGLDAAQTKSFQSAFKHVVGVESSRAITKERYNEITGENFERFCQEALGMAVTAQGEQA
jgi:hypothetical protein